MQQFASKINTMEESIQVQMAAFKQQIEPVSTRNKPEASNLEQLFRSLENSVNEQIKNIKLELHSIQNKLESQDTRMDQLEQYSRRNCLLIHGVEEGQRDENAYVKVIDVLNNRLNLTVTAEDIDRCHRLGVAGQHNRKKRPIIVKFVSYQTREAVWRGKRKLKNSGLLVTESLTRTRSELLSLVQTIVGPKNCWTQDGAIVAIQNEKKIRINNMHDTKQLTPN
jgi:hypothetical protein